MAGRIVYLSEVNPGNPPRMFEHEPDVMDARKVAEVLGVSLRTVRRLIATGALESFHVGASVRITKTALLRYIGEGVNDD